MFFWNSLAFSIIQWMSAIWSLVPLPILNPAWTSGSSQFTYCWSLAWRILSVTLLALFTTAKEWRHPSTHEWTKCVYTHNRVLLSLKKGGNTDTCYNNGWTMKTQCWVKDIRHKRPHIMILLIWRTQNSQFCRNRKENCGYLDLVGGRVSTYCWTGWKFLFRMMKKFWRYIVVTGA